MSEEYNKGLFHTWVPGIVQLVLVALFVSVYLLVNPIYSGNMGRMVSGTGINSEYFSWANYAQFIGMALLLPLFFRIKTRFRVKETVITSLLVMALMSIVTATTSSGVVFVGASLIFGMAKIMGMVDIVMVVFFILSPKGDRNRFYALFYPFAVIVGQLSVFITTNISFGLAWQSIHFYAAAILLIMAMLCVIFMHNKRFCKKVPFYRIDWLGMLLLATALLAVMYVFVFGKQQDWLESSRITTGIFVAITSTLALLLWESHVKRPLVSFKFFRQSDARVGLLLMCGLGMFMGINNIIGVYTSAILGYNWLINTSMILMMIPGIVTAGFVAFHWLKHKLPLRMYIFTGFAAYTLCAIVMYLTMSPGISINMLFLPQSLAGYGMVSLYISLWIYTLDKVPAKDSMSSSPVALAMRSILLPGIFVALFGWLQYKFQWQSIGDAAVYFDALTMTHNPGTGSLRDVQLGAILAANKRLLGYIITAGVGFLTFIFFHQFGRQKYIIADIRAYRSKRQNNLSEQITDIAGSI